YLDVPRVRDRLLHVALEADRDDLILASPDEQAARLEGSNPLPEALGSLALLQVDVARRRVEGHSAARREVGAQELVDARGGPVRVGARNDVLHHPLDDAPRRRLDDPELGAD